MSIVLGLDISSKSTGVAVMSETELMHYGLILIKNKKSNKNANTLKQTIELLNKEVLNLSIKYKPDLVVLEGVFYGPSAYVTALLNKLQGGVVSVIPKNTEILIVEALKARKEILGKGKRHSKEEVFTWVKNKFKLKKLTFEKHNDITDSILLAHYGLKVISTDLTL